MAALFDKLTPFSSSWLPPHSLQMYSFFTTPRHLYHFVHIHLYDIPYPAIEHELISNLTNMSVSHVTAEHKKRRLSVRDHIDLAFLYENKTNACHKVLLSTDIFMLLIFVLPNHHRMFNQSLNLNPGLNLWHSRSLATRIIRRNASVYNIPIFT